MDELVGISGLVCTLKFKGTFQFYDFFDKSAFNFEVVNKAVLELIEMGKSTFI